MAEEKQQIVDFRELGSTGLKRFSGFIQEEFLRELTGWKAIAIYKEMGDNDPTIASVLYAIEHLCRQVKWDVKPGGTEQEDLEAAEFLKSCMDDMDTTWTDTIAEIMSMPRYGHSLHEINYKRRCGDVLDPTMRSKYLDGRIGWRELPIRSQDTLYRWQFDNHGGIQGVEQIAPPHYTHVTIPTEKLLLFRTTTHKNNPEGKSILRGAYRPWYFKKHIENIEGIGIERDLAGLPMAMVPPEWLASSATPTMKQNLALIQKIVSNVRRDEQEGIVFPMAYTPEGKAMFDFKLLSTGGTRQFDTDKIVQRYDQRIAMVAMADFLFLGHSNVGSFALASSKTEMFSIALGSFLDIISSVFNRFAVPRLFALNDFNISKLPEITRGEIEKVDLKEIGDYISKLAGAGYPLFPNFELEKCLMKVANLPEPTEAEIHESLAMNAGNDGSKAMNQKEVNDPADHSSSLNSDNSDPDAHKAGDSENNDDQVKRGNPKL